MMVSRRSAEDKIKEKKYKNWKRIKERECWVEYKNVSNAAKSVVSKAKLGKYDKLNERLGKNKRKTSVHCTV